LFYWDFSLTSFFWLHYGSGVDPVSDYQRYILRV